MDTLLIFLRRLPGFDPAVGSGEEDGTWWVKFQLDLRHPLVWHVVQELAHVLNDLSVQEHLPAVFKPVSPPPYLNGGPDEFLSWVIEARADLLPPAKCAELLEASLPHPVDEAAAWVFDEA